MAAVFRLFSGSGSSGRAAVWLGFALAAALTAGPALAASGSWSATASGNWSDTGNWTGGTVADGSGFTATFASDISAATTVTLDSNRTISSVIFGDADTGTAANWVIGGAANTLTLDGNGGDATLTVDPLGSGSTATISRPIATANIGAGNSLVKNGVGTLILGADNSTGLTDKITVSGGSLQISNDNRLGAVPGSFVADQLTISGNATLRTQGGLTIPQNRGITVGSGGATLNLNGGVMVYEGRFTGVGNLVTSAGASGLNLANATATASDVDWDFTAARVFYNSTLALGTGDVRVRNNVRLVTQNNAGFANIDNALTLDSGAGLSARSTGNAVTYTGVIFPSSGTVIFNKDDQATTSLTITSGGSLSGNLTFNTWQEGTAALGGVTLSGVFSGAGGITKAGSGTDRGTLTLGGANTYAGNTTISAGTLALAASGSIANSAEIDVASGATFDVSAVTGGFALGAAQTLSGVGAVAGNVTANGTLSPGLAGAAGTLSLNNDLSLGSGTILAYQLNGTDVTVGGGVNDLIDVTGGLTLDGTINVTESVSGSFLSASEGDSWRLFTYGSSFTDNGLTLGTMPSLASGLTFSLDTGTANQVNLVVSAVPEPGTIVTALVGLGLVGIGATRRLRTRRVR